MIVESPAFQSMSPLADEYSAKRRGAVFVTAGKNASCVLAEEKEESM